MFSKKKVEENYKKSRDTWKVSERRCVEYLKKNLLTKIPYNLTKFIPNVTDIFLLVSGSNIDFLHFLKFPTNFLFLQNSFEAFL